MKKFVCNKCGSIDLFIKVKGTQEGLYCSDCGKWQKWLNKDEKLLAENWINENTIKNDTVTDNTSTNGRFSELEEASKPLIGFLNKYYNPMVTAIVTEGRVDIVSNEMGILLKVRD
jgi:late competence protein required for DNA uptake (superfamily II DNA/RNA helicase)